MFLVSYRCRFHLACKTGYTVNSVCIRQVSACYDKFQQHISLVVVAYFSYQPKLRMEICLDIILVKHFEDVFFHQRINLPYRRRHSNATFIAEYNNLVATLGNGIKQQIRRLHGFFIHIAKHAKRKISCKHGIKTEAIGHAHSKVCCITISWRKQVAIQMFF